MPDPTNQRGWRRYPFGFLAVIAAVMLPPFAPELNAAFGTLAVLAGVWLGMRLS